MPRGDKSAYTDKQQRQAAHIEASERKEGRSQEDAERIAWATVNKQTAAASNPAAAARTRSINPRAAAPPACGGYACRFRRG